MKSPTLLGYTLIWPSIPGRVYLAPPRGAKNFIAWAIEWEMLDCGNIRVKTTSQRDGQRMRKEFLRKMASTPSEIATGSRHAKIVELLANLDGHDEEMTESELGKFMSIWEQFSDRGNLSDKQIELLEQFYDRLEKRAGR